MRQSSSLRAAILFLLASCFAASAHAQVLRHWEGSVNNDWGTGANWSPGGVPAPSDYVYLNGNDAPVVTLSPLEIDDGGFVTLISPNTLLTSNSQTYVGRDGRGTLLVTTGGDAVMEYFSIGHASGGDGEVVVADSGSTLTANNVTNIGLYGNGLMRVTNGGDVTFTNRLSLGSYGAATGELLVAGPQSFVDMTSTLFEFTLGYEGTGTLTVSHDATVQTANHTVIGEYGIGVAVIESGAQWVQIGDLTMSNEANSFGQMTIRSGGQVTTQGVATLGGAGIQSSSLVTITGDDSRWNLTDSLSLILADIEVRDRGVLSTGPLMTFNGYSHLSVDGHDSVWTGYDADIIFSSSIEIAAGGRGNAHDISIYEGSLQVVGNASRLTANEVTSGYGSSFTVSNGGEADVVTTILDDGFLFVVGGTLNTQYLEVADGGAAFYHFNNGVINVEGGAITEGPWTTVDAQSTDDHVVFNQIGSTHAGADFVVGENQQGEWNLLDGATTNALQSLVIGDNAGSDGTVTVESSTLGSASTDALIVGNAGRGVLNIAAGAAVVSELVVVGDQAAGYGEVHANGGTLDADFLDVGNVGSGLLTIDGNAIVTVQDELVVATLSRIELRGGRLTINDADFATDGLLFTGGELDVEGFVDFADALNVPTFGTLRLAGHVDGRVTSAVGSTVVVDGTASMGSSSALAGVSLHGTLGVGSHTLTVHSIGRAALGESTTLLGGTIIAANGVALGDGDILFGDGVVQGPVSAGYGSLIAGAFTLGDATRFDGFASDGNMIIDDGVGQVTLLDANEAVLGSYTQLVNDATLNAANGAVLEFGKVIQGFGTVNTPDNAATPFINNGHIEGDSVGDTIQLTGYIKGVGTMNNVVITGTDAPGFSPATVTRGTVTYAGKVEIDLAGTATGQYDVIQHTGTANLGGDLEVLTINGYTPTLGDSFTLLTASSLTGTFTFLSPVFNEIYYFDAQYTASTLTLELIAFLLPGDANNDGVVDAADYLTVESNLGSLGAADGLLLGDANDDGRVDGDDWLAIEQHFGDVWSGPTPTPEPGTVALLLIALGLTYRPSTARSRSCGQVRHTSS